MKFYILKNVYIALQFVLMTNFASAEPCGVHLWRKTDGSTTMALRSNAPHFWLVAGAELKPFLPAEIYKFTGLVVGDAHQENFAHIFVNLQSQQRVYVPNDWDDFGVAPLYLDFLKFLIVSRSVQASETRFSSQKMHEMYLAGLRGQAFIGKFPSLLKEDYALTQGQLREDYLKKIDRYVKDKKKVFHDGTEDFVTWKEMSSAQKAIFNRMHNDFAKVLPQGYEIHDRAMTAKEGGGSEGALRFWYFISRGADQQMIEFKQHLGSSLRHFNPNQPSIVELVEKMRPIFFSGVNHPLLQVVRSENKVFFMRPKYPKYVDLQISDLKEDAESFRELSYFIAYQLGIWHGQQSAPYVQYVSDNLNFLVDHSKAVQKYYLDLVKQLR